MGPDSTLLPRDTSIIITSIFFLDRLDDFFEETTMGDNLAIHNGHVVVAFSTSINLGCLRWFEPWLVHAGGSTS
jgi:hypothetical protein